MKIIKKISLCGILSAFALLSFILENLFPPLFLPGARLGISNVFILLSAIVIGYKYGFCALIIKSVLGSVFSGNISAIIYSLPAGLISLTIELVLLKFTTSSLIAISVCGSMVNITVQNFAFCLVTQSFEYMSFVPYLALIGSFSGLMIGLVVLFALKRIPLSLVRENNKLID